MFKFFFLICSCALLCACILGERREPETVFQDDAVDVKINYELANNEEISSQSHITVTAYNRKVLLTGQVPNEAIKQQLTELAKNNENVQTVYNELSVGPVTGLVQRAQDTWTTTQIKALLAAENSYGLNQTKVITENAVVYLIGIVTQEEAEIAKQTARNIKGVKEVATFFEYVAA